jgi:hypothetical protein
MMVHNWRQQTAFREMPLFIFEYGDEGRGLLIDKLSRNGFGIPSFRFPKDTNTTKGLHRGFIPLQSTDLLANTIFTASHERKEPDYTATEVMWKFQKHIGTFSAYRDEDLETLKQDFDSNERLKESVEKLTKIKNERLKKIKKK